MEVNPALTQDNSSNHTKDDDEEFFLEQLNGKLSAWEIENYSNSLNIKQTIYIVGLPRSGTTLLNQLLATHLNVGYVNQLTASMWRAPVTGLRLSNKLLPNNLQSDYKSVYAKTSSIVEPHEFGYFWKYHLGYKNLMEPTEAEIEGVNWKLVRLIVQNMSHTVQKPFVFKPLMIAWYLSKLVKECPESRIVWISRDPMETAISILKMRKNITGDIRNWHSLKIENYKNIAKLHPYEQVSLQVARIYLKLQNEHERLSATNMIRISYIDLCRNPEATIMELVEYCGGNIEIRRKSDIANLELQEQKGNGGYLSRSEHAQLENCLSKAFSLSNLYCNQL